MDSAKFAQWFRSSSPYIRAHRNKVFLVYFTEEALAHELLTNIVHDLALLHVMGVRVVLVPELRCGSGIGSHPLDSDGLAEYLGQVGKLRNHLEAEFATGVPGSQFHSRHVPLVSGNFLQAKPRGIVQGVDMQFAGETRKVHEGEIRKLLEAGIVVLVPPLGHCSSGVMYALGSNEVAQKVAVSLGADKLILMGPIAKLGDHSDLTTQALDEVLAEIPLAPELQRQLQTLGDACKEGVARAHVISHEIDGSLLQELFTASGVGTQISDASYRDIRPATTDDISAIAELLKPLEEEGILLDRSRARLVEEPEHFLISELDGVVIGCVALYDTDATMIEIGSLVTDSSYQGANVGRQLLQAAESEAKRRGATSVYVLTVNAMDWFEENGYVPMHMGDLPSTRLERYSAIRNSKPFIKQLT